MFATASKEHVVGRGRYFDFLRPSNKVTVSVLSCPFTTQLVRRVIQSPLPPISCRPGREKLIFGLVAFNPFKLESVGGYRITPNVWPLLLKFLILSLSNGCFVVDTSFNGARGPSGYFTQRACDSPSATELPTCIAPLIVPTTSRPGMEIELSTGKGLLKFETISCCHHVLGVFKYSPKCFVVRSALRCFRELPSSLLKF